MRRLLIAIVGVGIVGVAVYATLTMDNSTTVENPRIEQIEVEKEVAVDALEIRIREAQEEAMSEIDTRANEMRDKFVENELKTIEAQVLKEVEAEIKTRRTDVEKQTGAY